MKKNSAATATATTAMITPTKCSVQPVTGNNKSPIVDTLWHCEATTRLAKNATVYVKPKKKAAESAES